MPFHQSPLVYNLGTCLSFFEVNRIRKALPERDKGFVLLMYAAYN